MKSINVHFTSLLLVCFGVGLFSCEKESNVQDFGVSKIYMPQATNQSGGVNASYMVPMGTDSSTYNYAVDAASQKLNVVLGASLSGISRTGFAVEVKTYADTIQRLINSNVLDKNTMLMPSTVYTLPNRVEVEAGKGSKSFMLTLDISQLKKAEYAGKKLALVVGLANPTAYVLNPVVAKTMVIVDVDALVIGPAVEVTSQYLQNAGSPFKASATDPGGRWGTLANWVANSAAMSHNGVGGYSKDGDGENMNMESGWGSPVISNGKIYQTTTLPAGTYAFDPSPWVWQGTKDPAYVVVAVGSELLPDYKAVPTASNTFYTTFDKARVNFQLSAPMKVTLGVVVNYVQDQQGFKTKAVHLYTFPKHL